ncbi:hypothetical protein [Tsukamurella soli]|uniref:Uncharacterized protein n=1 Tax=Tsukamurella soli TaxID=644556 RepID=A0ABP8K1G8_9ACTN
MSDRARGVMVAVSAVGTVIGLAGLSVLWTQPMPGWWFTAVFTVMIVVVLAGFWAAYLTSIARARRERDSARAWTTRCAGARMAAGRVTARDVALAESGGVSGFTLEVTPDAGPPLTARWHGGAERLLQTQVPDIGAPVRVWTADWMAVVEAGDPTVVA